MGKQNKKNIQRQTLHFEPEPVLVPWREIFDRRRSPGNGTSVAHAYNEFFDEFIPYYTFTNLLIMLFLKDVDDITTTFKKGEQLLKRNKRLLYDHVGRSTYAVQLQPSGQLQCELSSVETAPPLPCQFTVTHNGKSESALAFDIYTDDYSGQFCGKFLKKGESHVVHVQLTDGILNTLSYSDEFHGSFRVRSWEVNEPNLGNNSDVVCQKFLYAPSMYEHAKLPQMDGPGLQVQILFVKHVKPTH